MLLLWKERSEIIELVNTEVQTGKQLFISYFHFFDLYFGYTYPSE